VLNQALGGGMASRLFQEVREKRGLVYSVYSYQGQHADTGTFAVYAGTAPRKADTVLEVVRAELDAVLSGGLHDREFERAKGYLAGAMVLALEDTGSRMTRLGKAAITDTPLLSLDESIAAVEAVTPADVAAVGQRMLGGPFTLAVVGPFGDAEEERLRAYVRREAA
jgi:predicted Zn-dependent peptidase